MKALISSWKSGVSLAGLGLVLLIFQNCSQGFRQMGDEASSLSSQCKLSIQESAKFLAELVGPGGCEDPDQYRCEARIFSPDHNSDVQKTQVCVDSETCVMTEIRHFDTSASRSIAGLDSRDFEAGGEFNRSEFRCYHSQKVRGVHVFESEAENLDEALASVRSKCQASEASGAQ